MNNRKRIIAAEIVSILAVSSVLLIVRISPLVFAGYVFIVTDIVLAAAMLLQLVDGGMAKYLTNVGMTLALKSALAISAIIAVAVPLCEAVGAAMPLKWFLVIEIFIYAAAALTSLALGAGQEEIERQERKHFATTVKWKNLRLKIETISSRCPAELKRDVSAARDAIRYADPIEDPSFAALDHDIATAVGNLAALVDDGHHETVPSACAQIVAMVRDRAERKKAFH